MGRANVSEQLAVPRRRRGRRVGVVLLVLLLLLIGAVVAADRIAANVAANRIAEQATTEMQARGMTSASKPEATIGGFPFLTQVIRGEYQKITIKVDKPQTQQVKLDQLTLVATNVRAPASDLLNGTGTVVASQLTGTAIIGWEAVKSLVQLAGLPSSVDPKALQVRVVDNNVELRLPLQVAGVAVTLRATGTLAVAEGRVRIQ